MKTGRTLSELAAELERQANSKKDFVASTANMRVVVAVPSPQQAPVARLALGDREPLSMNEIAHDQIGTHTGIPAKYYDRMRLEAPGLLANNINEWFAKYPATRLVRSLDGNARAFLSDAYRPLENFDLAEAVLPILLDLKLDIMSCEVTERRLYIKAVDERLKRDVPKGHAMGDGTHTFFDTVSPAVIIGNSEVGCGSLFVETGVFTKVCTNLAMIAGGGMKRRHVGARHALTDGEQVQHLLSDATKKATDKAIWMQVRDIVRAGFDEARFGATVDKLKGLTEQKIEGDPVKVVELSTKKFGMTETEGKSILRHLIEGADLTRYGLFNAITRTAQDLPSYDRASEFERVGGQVVELPKNEWRELAMAA